MRWIKRGLSRWVVIASVALTATVAPTPLDHPVRAQDAAHTSPAWAPEAGSRLPFRQKVEGRDVLRLDSADGDPALTYEYARQLTGTLEFLESEGARRMRARLRIDSVRLSQTGDTTITASATRAGDRSVTLESSVESRELDDDVREGMGRELEGFLRSLIVQPVEFVLDDEGRVHEPAAELKPFENLYDPAGEATAFLVRTLGARHDGGLVHSLAAAAVVRVPGADAAAEDEFLFDGELSVLAARVGARGLATRKSVDADVLTLDQRFSATTAGPVLILRRSAPLFPKLGKLAGSDIREEKSHFEGALRFDTKRGLPVEHAFSGTTFEGSMIVSGAAPGSGPGRRVHLSSTASVQLTWGADDGDTSDAPSTAEDAGPRPLEEVAPEEGPWELAWRVEVGRKLRLTSKQQVVARVETKLDGSRQPKQVDRENHRTIAVAEVIGRPRGAGALKLRMRLEEVRAESAGPTSEYSVHVRASDDGKVLCDLDGKVAGIDASAAESKTLEELVGHLYRPLITPGITLTLWPDGSVTDIEIADEIGDAVIDEPESPLARAIAPILGGFDRILLAELIFPRLFIDLPGKFTDVGDEWTREVVDPRFSTTVELSRSTRFASRSAKAMIRDEMRADEAEEQTELMFRTILAGASGGGVRTSMDSVKNRGKPVIGKTIYDPVGGLPELRRMQGRVADVEMKATMSGPGGRIPIEFRMRMDYEEELRCDLLDEE